MKMIQKLVLSIGLLGCAIFETWASVTASQR